MGAANGQVGHARIAVELAPALVELMNLQSRASIQVAPIFTAPRRSGEFPVLRGNAMPMEADLDRSIAGMGTGAIDTSLSFGVDNFTMQTFREQGLWVDAVDEHERADMGLDSKRIWLARAAQLAADHHSVRLNRLLTATNWSGRESTATYDLAVATGEPVRRMIDSALAYFHNNLSMSVGKRLLIYVSRAAALGMSRANEVSSTRTITSAEGGIAALGQNSLAELQAYVATMFDSEIPIEVVRDGTLYTNTSGNKVPAVPAGSAYFLVVDDNATQSFVSTPVLDYSNQAGLESGELYGEGGPGLGVPIVYETAEPRGERCYVEATYGLHRYGDGANAGVEQTLGFRAKITSPTLST